MPTKKFISSVLFVLIIFLFTRILPYAQNYDNPCFFCHMNVLVEMKSAATLHWENEVQCSACHGESVKHIDVEDNSIKPDSIWTLFNVHQLCANCHSECCLLYTNSPHAVFLEDSINTNALDFPSCVTCHGSHTLKESSEIERECLECHNSLPEVCQTRKEKSEETQDIVSCTTCHSPHKVEILIK